jgi:type IV pilus assembly protein PilC
MEYTYTARELRTGRRVESNANAESVSGLVKDLHRKGLLLLEVSEVSQQGRFHWTKLLPQNPKKVKSKELAVFTRQLAATMKSGLLLSDALDTLAEDLDNPYFQKVIQKTRELVMGGHFFSQALTKFPEVFPKSYVSVITTGEATGRMDVTLESLAKFLENMERIKQKVRTAIQYPMFVFGFALLVVLVMVLVVIPKFKEIFSQLGAPLPWFTQMVVGFSDFVIHQWLWIVVFILMAGFVFNHFRKIPKISYWMDEMLLRLPIIGKDIVHKFLVGRFCRTMGFMLSAGVSLPRTLEIITQIIQHQPCSHAIRVVQKRILGGSTLTDAIKEHAIFPKLVQKMTLVGEKTGGLDQMMTRTADYYDDELEVSIHNVMVLIEPIMIIIVGLMVGVVVVALYLPIFKVSLLVK